MNQTTFDLGNGIDGLYIRSDRFNTTLISFYFYLPIEPGAMANRALLPYVMSTCSEEYPDFSKLNFKLCSLYGAKISASVGKVGNCQLLRLSISCINDRFSLDNESVVMECAKLLASLIFAPSIKDNAFCEEDVEREKRMMRERILGEINDKRIYARNKLLKIMFEGDAFGIERFGSLEDVEKITGQSLFSAWEEVLRKAYVRVQISAEECPKKVFDSVKAAFTAINRNEAIELSEIPPYSPREFSRVEEKMDVKQGKLVMGFHSAERGDTRTSLPLLVMSDLFGGGPYSKLFSNVREKMSLCYYCSVSSNREKGFLVVESGVEAENAVKAEAAILEQLEAIRRGDFSKEDMAASIAGLKDSFRSSSDSQSALDYWYGTKIYDRVPISPEDVSLLIDTVTAEDIQKAAAGVSLTSIYLLMPETEEAE